MEDCLTFPVNQQCHLTHEIRLDNRKTFLVFNFLHLTPEIHYEGIRQFFTLGSTGPTKYCTTFCMLQAQGLISQDMKIKNRGTIPMPTFAGRPSTMSYLRWIFRRIPWLDSKGSKYPKCNSSVHHFFDVGIYDSKTKRLLVVIFYGETMLWINEVEMVCSLEELKSPRSVCSRDLPNFEMLDVKIASALKEIIRNSHHKKKVSLEELKVQKEDRFQ